MFGIGKKKKANNTTSNNQKSLYSTDNKQSLIDENYVHNQLMQQAKNEDQQTKFLQVQQEQQVQQQQQIQQVQQQQQQQATTQVAQQQVETPTTKEYADIPTNYSKKANIPVKRYRYTVLNSLGKKENGTMETETEEDLKIFLQGLDYKVLEIKERPASDIDIGGNGRIKAGALSFSLTQLSTYIKSGIPLADSVKILAKQTKKPNLKKSYCLLVYQLLKGESFSDAMEMQGDFYPKLLINMVKTAEMTGDLPSILDDMAEYYTSMDQTRKQMKSAMTYPIVVLLIAFGVLIFMLTYLVPQFTAMFEDNGATLPALTQTIINISSFVFKSLKKQFN